MELRVIQRKLQQKQPNHTGIPIQTKLQIEKKSGLSFDDVRVHYNSDKPAKLGALAYARNNQIHLGRGQERYLWHELRHVEQQKRGLVRPTTWINGYPVNDAPALEKEADRSEPVRGGNGVAVWNNVIQCERSPTFFTYLFTKNGYDLSMFRQGPHTIAETYYEFLVEHYCLEDLFNEMIPDLNEIKNIIEEEEVEFDSEWTKQKIQHTPHSSYVPLENIIEEEKEDFPARLDRYYREYQQLYDTFQNLQESGEEIETPYCRDIICRLLNMHPYATYGWRKTYPTKQDLQGKGEGSVRQQLNTAIAASEGYNSFIKPKVLIKLIDTGAFKTFHNRAKVNNFLLSRLRNSVKDVKKFEEKINKLKSESSG